MKILTITVDDQQFEQEVKQVLKEHRIAFSETDIADKLRREMLRDKFSKLVSIWREQTKPMSFAKEMAEVESYRQIIGMGEEVLPFIFEQMQQQPEHWFLALRQITGQNPVQPQHKGDLRAMTHDWLTWAGMAKPKPTDGTERS